MVHCKWQKWEHCLTQLTFSRTLWIQTRFNDNCMLLDYDARNLNMRFMSSDVYRHIWLKFARQKSIKPEQWQFSNLISRNSSRKSDQSTMSRCLTLRTKWQWRSWMMTNSSQSTISRPLARRWASPIFLRCGESEFHTTHKWRWYECGKNMNDLHQTSAKIVQFHNGMAKTIKYDGYELDENLKKARFYEPPHLTILDKVLLTNSKMVKAGKPTNEYVFVPLDWLWWRHRNHAFEQLLAPGISRELRNSNCVWCNHDANTRNVNDLGDWGTIDTDDSRQDDQELPRQISSMVWRSWESDHFLLHYIKLWPTTRLCSKSMRRSSQVRKWWWIVNWTRSYTGRYSMMTMLSFQHKLHIEL